MTVLEIVGTLVFLGVAIPMAAGLLIYRHRDKAGVRPEDVRDRAVVTPPQAPSPTPAPTSATTAHPPAA